MSTTIGFGYSTQDEVDLYESLKAIAENYGYGIYEGIKYAEPDVRAGLEIAKKNEDWKHIILLQYPKDHDVCLAFGIEEELINFEVKNEKPTFFAFLEQLELFSLNKCNKLGLFFASEWFKEDRVRYSYGSMCDLIKILSMPGHWGVRYLIPETGRLQDSDEIPLIFDVNLKKVDKRGE